MRVSAEFYSVYREAIGKKKIEMEIEKKISIKEFLRMLTEIYPSLKKYIRFAIVSINNEYSKGDEILKDGDNIVIFPPIGGG